MDLIACGMIAVIAVLLATFDEKAAKAASWVLMITAIILAFLAYPA